MAYNEEAVTALRDAIESQDSSLNRTINALMRVRELLVPEMTSPNPSLFASAEPAHWVATTASAQPAINAALDDLRTYSDTAMSTLTSIINQSVDLGIQPLEAANITGSGAFQTLKNWEFGSAEGNTVRNFTDLDTEFQYHDQFNQICNGSGLYGTITMATSVATRITDVAGVVPGNPGFQPVDNDPSRPYREFTPDSLVCYVRPLVAGQTIGPAYTHNGGSGKIVAKFSLPPETCNGPGRKDICFETRMRFVSPGSFDGNPAHPKFATGYWSAIWTCGSMWDFGPEMDVMESYSDTSDSGLRNGNAFHVNSVGGDDERFNGGDPWWVGMIASGMPGVASWGPQQLTNWHVFTWIYYKDDSYEVWVDGYRFQFGTLEWTVPQGANIGVAPAMHFLWDFDALHTQIYPINEQTIPTGDQPLKYEISRSRIWTRD